jgi:hypothetical protein
MGIREANLLHALQKSRQLSALALDRLGDYLALLRIELTLQGREIGAQIAAYVAAAFFAVFALFFVGMAIIISFWDSAYRGIAAWVVVAMYIGATGIALSAARRHAGKRTVLSSLSEEIKRDAALIRENL